MVTKGIPPMRVARPHPPACSAASEIARIFGMREASGKSGQSLLRADRVRRRVDAERRGGRDRCQPPRGDRIPTPCNVAIRGDGWRDGRRPGCVGDCGGRPVVPVGASANAQRPVARPRHGEHTGSARIGDGPAATRAASALARRARSIDRACIRRGGPRVVALCRVAPHARAAPPLVWIVRTCTPRDCARTVREPRVRPSDSVEAALTAERVRNAFPQSGGVP